jgi:hypothetical protein
MTKVNFSEVYQVTDQPQSKTPWTFHYEFVKDVPLFPKTAVKNNGCCGYPTKEHAEEARQNYIKRIEEMYVDGVWLVVDEHYKYKKVFSSYEKAHSYVMTLSPEWVNTQEYYWHFGTNVNNDTYVICRYASGHKITFMKIDDI